MKNKIAATILACLAMLAIAVGCTRQNDNSVTAANSAECPKVTPAECPELGKKPPAAEPLGRFEAGMPDDAVIRLYLTADGTMVWAEGKRGGNWDEQFVFDGTPTSLGKPLADIKIWEHDGTETDMAKDDGTSAHVHSGPVHPPLGNHCHRWVRIGTRYILVHC